MGLLPWHKNSHHFLLSLHGPYSLTQEFTLYLFLSPLLSLVLWHNSSHKFVISLCWVSFSELKVHNTFLFPFFLCSLTQNFTQWFFLSLLKLQSVTQEFTSFSSSPSLGLGPCPALGPAWLVSCSSPYTWSSTMTPPLLAPPSHQHKACQSKTIRL